MCLGMHLSISHNHKSQFHSSHNSQAQRNHLKFGISNWVASFLHLTGGKMSDSGHSPDSSERPFSMTDTPLNNDIDILRLDIEEVANEKGIGGNSDFGRVQVDSVDEGPEEDHEDSEPLEDQGKLRSEVWDHMEVVTLPSGVQKKCKHCKKLLSVQSGGTTSHLIRHLKQSCPFKNKYFPKPLNDATTASHGLHQSQLLCYQKATGIKVESLAVGEVEALKRFKAAMKIEGVERLKA